ncbi:hypothetical protein OAQ01_00055 [Emcibacteraceae bacterium]|nr:hypothetical protein [Emcibacteraceae bacterium]
MNTPVRYILVHRIPILSHTPLRNMAAFFNKERAAVFLCDVTKMDDLKKYYQIETDNKTIVIIGDALTCLILLFVRPSLVKSSIFYCFEMHGYQVPSSSLLRMLKNAILRLSNYLACSIYPKIIFPNTLRKNFYVEKWPRIKNKSYVFENYYRDNTDFLEVQKYRRNIKERINSFRDKFSTIICYVGLIQPGRDIEVLIDSISDTGVGLFLAGKDGLRIAKKADKNSNICYLNLVTQDEAYYIYSNSDWGYLNYDNTIPNTRFCAPVKIYEYISADLGIISNDNIALVEKSDLIDYYFKTSQELRETIKKLPSQMPKEKNKSTINFDDLFKNFLAQITRDETRLK